MWNDLKVFDYDGMIAETVRIPGHDGGYIRAYYSRPITAQKTPGIVLIPHMPGWDEWCRETARRFTEHGYSVICPNIYEDYGDGTAPEVSGKVREAGGVADKSVMEDVAGSLSFLRNQVSANGKVGVIGMCSGGRHTFLAAATLDGIDAAVDCWGGGVVAPPESLTPARPVAPIDCAEGIRRSYDFSSGCTYDPDLLRSDYVLRTTASVDAGEPYDEGMRLFRGLTAVEAKELLAATIENDPAAIIVALG